MITITRDALWCCVCNFSIVLSGTLKRNLAVIAHTAAICLHYVFVDFSLIGNVSAKSMIAIKWYCLAIMTTIYSLHWIVIDHDCSLVFKLILSNILLFSIIQSLCTVTVLGRQLIWNIVGNDRINLYSPLKYQKSYKGKAPFKGSLTYNGSFSYSKS